MIRVGEDAPFLYVEGLGNENVIDDGVLIEVVPKGVEGTVVGIGIPGEFVGVGNLAGVGEG